MMYDAKILVLKIFDSIKRGMLYNLSFCINILKKEIHIMYLSHNIELFEKLFYM